MSFCKNCGERLQENTLFCPNCGTRVSLEAEPSPLVKAQVKPKPYLWIGILLAVIISIAAVGAAWVYLVPQPGPSWTDSELESFEFGLSKIGDYNILTYYQAGLKNNQWLRYDLLTITPS